MNKSQALREACKRWGKSAFVEQSVGTAMLAACRVGRVENGFMGVRYMAILGNGRTWAEAFWDADTREARSAAYHEAMGQPCPRCSRTMTTAVPRLSKRRQAIAGRLRLLIDRTLCTRALHNRSKREYDVDELRRKLNQLIHPHSPCALRIAEAPGFIYICRSCHAKAEEQDT